MLERRCGVLLYEQDIRPNTVTDAGERVLKNPILVKAAIDTGSDFRHDSALKRHAKKYALPPN
jgi:hypothetical protein